MYKCRGDCAECYEETVAGAIRERKNMIQLEE